MAAPAVRCLRHPLGHLHRPGGRARRADRGRGGDRWPCPGRVPPDDRGRPGDRHRADGRVRQAGRRPPSGPAHRRRWPVAGRHDRRHPGRGAHSRANPGDAHPDVHGAPRPDRARLPELVDRRPPGRRTVLLRDRGAPGPPGTQSGRAKLVRFLDAATCPVEPESRAFTDAALAALRAEGWSRGGWAHFADQVARRSAQQVAAHPRAAAELTALHVGFALAGRGRGRRWVVISWLMAVTHLGLLGQRRSIGWANVLSLARASLVVTGEPLGRWVGVAALLSDKLDGTVARRTRPTMFGFYADSLADAAFWTWLGIRREPSPCVRLASL